MEKWVESFKKSGALPQAIICGDGEIGVALKKALLQHGLNHAAVVSVDDYPETEGLSLSVYRQSFELMAQEVCGCLLQQNQQAAQWKASVKQIKGKMIER